MFSPADTIVAVATPPGRGGIGVVRVSGPGAGDVAARILTAKEPLAARGATFTHVVAQAAPEQSSEATAARAVDQVVATFFPGPASYTGEDVLEVSAHGSPVVLDHIVRAAMAAGARLAEPGEFTLRAFLNGRVDLVQAEAVADLVNAVTPLQARAAFDQLEGTLTAAIGRIDAALFDLIARLEASIDFPDEGYHFLARGDIEAELHRVAIQVADLLADARSGRIVREGREVVIAGTPNVGKSTLFNRLVGTERAIVTPVAGTTRDLVTETIDVRGVRTCLVDTAGVRQVDDLIEAEGVRRAVGAAAIADLVVVVLDRSRPLDEDDWRLLASTAKADRLIVANKCDLPAAWDMNALSDAGGAMGPSASDGTGAAGHDGSRRREGPIEISLRTGDGVTVLKQRLGSALLGTESTREMPRITNVRHIELLSKAADAVGRGRAALADSEGELPEEFLLSDLQAAQAALEEVTGRRTTEDLLRHIFAKFCVGK
jgi:tRNA modification GTPase